MKKALLILVFLFAVAAQAKIFVDVTEMTSQVLSPEEKVFVTDQIRGVASQVLPKNDFGVMTHENIESDKNLVAEYICQGRVGQIGSKLAVTVELLSVKGGVLVSSINFRADNIDGVLNELEKMLGSSKPCVREIC